MAGKSNLPDVLWAVYVQYKVNRYSIRGREKKVDIILFISILIDVRTEIQHKPYVKEGKSYPASTCATKQTSEVGLGGG